MTVPTPRIMNGRSRLFLAEKIPTQKRQTGEDTKDTLLPKKRGRPVPVRTLPSSHWPVRPCLTETKSSVGCCLRLVNSQSNPTTLEFLTIHQGLATYSRPITFAMARPANEEDREHRHPDPHPHDRFNFPVNFSCSSTSPTYSTYFDEAKYFVSSRSDSGVP